MEIIKEVRVPVNAVVERVSDITHPLEALAHQVGKRLRELIVQSDYEELLEPEPTTRRPRAIRDADFYHSHKVEAKRSMVGSVPGPHIFNGGPDRRTGERRQRINRARPTDRRQSDRRGAYLIPS